MIFLQILPESVYVFISQDVVSISKIIYLLKKWCEMKSEQDWKNQVKLGHFDALDREGLLRESRYFYLIKIILKTIYLKKNVIWYVYKKCVNFVKVRNLTNLSEMWWVPSLAGEVRVSLVIGLGSNYAIYNFTYLLNNLWREIKSWQDSKK